MGDVEGTAVEERGDDLVEVDSHLFWLDFPISNDQIK